MANYQHFHGKKDLTKLYNAAFKYVEDAKLHEHSGQLIEAKRLYLEGISAFKAIVQYETNDSKKSLISKELAAFILKAETMQNYEPELKEDNKDIKYEFPSYQTPEKVMEFLNENQNDKSGMIEKFIAQISSKIDAKCTEYARADSYAGYRKDGSMISYHDDDRSKLRKLESDMKQFYINSHILKSCNIKRIYAATSFYKSYLNGYKYDALVEYGYIDLDSPFEEKKIIQFLNTNKNDKKDTFSRLVAQILSIIHKKYDGVKKLKNFELEITKFFESYCNDKFKEIEEEKKEYSESSPMDLLKAMYVKEEREKQLHKKVKVRLKIGSVVEVYSTSRKEWLQGTIKDIKGDTLCILYSNGKKMKWVTKDSPNFRPKKPML